MSYFAIKPRPGLVFGENRANLVFEWNGVDASQFEAVRQFNSAGTATPRTATIGVTSAANLGPHPRMLTLQGDGTTEANDGVAVFLAQDPIVFPDDQRRFIIELNSDFASGAGSPGLGVFVMGDNTGSDLVGYVLDIITNRGSRVEGGQLNTGAIQANAAAVSGEQFYHITGRRGRAADPNGDFPHFQLISESSHNNGNASIEGSLWQNTYDASDGDWGIGSLPGVEWNDTAANRWGLVLYANSNNPYYDFWNINDVRIYTI